MIKSGFGLSIITTTYNSESYIEKTVLGILNQKFDQDYEYIISDDASTDKTIDILSSIKDSHENGQFMRILKNQYNQGVMKNFFNAVLQTKGNFLAFCDSDDEWGDPLKLQKQYDYLENNPGCSLVYHAYYNKLDKFLDNLQISYFEEPLNKIMLKPQTSTMMVSGVLRSKINWNVIEEAIGPQNDQYLRFLLKDEGYFKFLSSIMPNKRIVRSGSIYSTVDILRRKEAALQSWTTFCKFHGAGDNKKYLAKKVQGFQSSVNWLKFRKEKKLNCLIKAFRFDINNGLIWRKIYNKFTAFLLSPYRYYKELKLKKLLPVNS